MLRNIEVLFLACVVLVGLSFRSELGEDNKHATDTSTPKPSLMQKTSSEYYGNKNATNANVQQKQISMQAGDYSENIRMQEIRRALGNPLVRNDVLLPVLVPGRGETFVFKNKEKARIVETNEYTWELDEVGFPGRARKVKADFTFAKLKGKWKSNTFGHQSVHVKDVNGKEMFKIRRSRSRLNPMQLRWSFRILPPGSKDNDDALFTINKDFWGRGIPVLWEKEEWRIYRGREREDNLMYYCVGSWMGFDFKFYRSVAEYEHHANPVAKIEQKRNLGAFVDNNLIPDKFELKVYEGADSALLLAVSTIIDIVHDSSHKDDRWHID